MNVMVAPMDGTLLVLAGVRSSSCRSLASDDMTEKDFQKYDRAMRRSPGSRASKRAVPRKCKECEYYRPNWKYRNCYFAKCSYHLKDSTIRTDPLSDNPFQSREVVNMNEI